MEMRKSKEILCKIGNFVILQWVGGNRIAESDANVYYPGSDCLATTTGEEIDIVRMTNHRQSSAADVSRGFTQSSLYRLNDQWTQNPPEDKSQ